MKRKVTLLLLLFCIFTLHAQGVYKTDKDLSYVSDEETDAYRKERCKLDVYYPVDKKDFPTIVWFHGDRKSTRLNSIHTDSSRMPSSA